MLNIGQHVTIKLHNATGSITSAYSDSSGAPVYTVRMDDTNFNESGYMLAREFELSEVLAD